VGPAPAGSCRLPSPPPGQPRARGCTPRGVTGDTAVVGAWRWLPVRHHACAAVQLRPSRSHRPLQPCWERSHQGRLPAPLPPRCLPLGCRGEPAAGGFPAWPGGSQKRASTHAEPRGAGTRLGQRWGHASLQDWPLWARVEHGPGSPGRWHSSGRRRLCGAVRSSLSGSTAASASTAPAAPGGKAVPGWLHPATPRTSPAQGLTGRSRPRR